MISGLAAAVTGEGVLLSLIHIFVKSAWHLLSIDRRENQHSRAPGAARKTKLFYTGTKPQEENDEGE